MLEGIFSTQRRKFDPSSTNARFDDVMFFDQHVLVPLRQRGRSIGEEERKKSKEKRESRTVVEPEANSKNQQFNESAPDWCETYAQVHGILDLVQMHFLPKFTRERMKDAPKVRDLRENDSYTSQDVKLAEEWTSTLEEGAAAYHRDVSCAELVQKGKEVKLSFRLDDKNVAASAPIFNRLCYQYYEANFSVLEMELRCHLPLSLVAMRAVSKNSWPECFNLKLLLVTLLPPNVRGTDIAECFKENGSLLKGKALIALNIFLRNVRLLLEYLGCHADDIRDVRCPQVVSPYVKGAGPAAAFCLIGAYLIPKLDRLHNGDEIEKVNGKEIEKVIFMSIFGSQSPADAALSV